MIVICVSFSSDLHSLPSGSLACKQVDCEINEGQNWFKKKNKTKKQPNRTKSVLNELPLCCSLFDVSRKVEHRYHRDLHHFINTANEVTFTHRAATVDSGLQLTPPAGQCDGNEPLVLWTAGEQKHAWTTEAERKTNAAISVHALNNKVVLHSFFLRNCWKCRSCSSIPQLTLNGFMS